MLAGYASDYKILASDLLNEVELDEETELEEELEEETA